MCLVAVLQVQTAAPHPAGADGDCLETFSFACMYFMCMVSVVQVHTEAPRAAVADGGSVFACRPRAAGADGGAPSCKAHGGTLV